MRKGKRRNTALFLVFCMVLSMFSAIPARAAYDESQEDVYGLVAVDWLGTYWDEQEECDKILLGTDGRPAEPNWDEEVNGVPAVGGPISYTDCKEVSISDLGSALWIDYRASLGDAPTPVPVDDLTVEYFGEEDPRGNEESAEPKNRNDLIEEYQIKTNNDDVKTLVLFKPDKLGYYRFSCEQCGDDNEKKLIVHVDYPEIGIYSKPEQSMNNLYPVHNECEEENFDYIGLGGDDKNVVYVDLYNRYSSDSIKLDECELNFWSEEQEPLTIPFDGTSGEIATSDYMSVEKVSAAQNDNDNWYKITFTKELSSEEGFGLDIKATKSYEDENGEHQDKFSAHLEVSFQQSGLYVTCDGEYRSDDEKLLSYPGGINPEAAELKFGNIERDQETGKVKDEFLSLQGKTIGEEIKIEAGNVEWHKNDDGFDWTKKDGDTENDCDCKVTEEGLLEIKSYYQEFYKITIGGESVYVHPYIDTIEFFDTAKRPEDSEPITNRICKTKVDEGKTKTVYVLAYMKENDAFAANMDAPTIKATLEDGTEVNDYIDIKDDRITEVTGTDEDDGVEFGYSGYPIEITAQAKEDFYITVAANGPVKWDDQYLSHEKKLLVEINKRSSLKVTPPTKTTYTEGETFDSTGMEVKLVYEDGKTEPVKIEDCTITPAGALTTADTSVTVTYLGKTTTQPITVNAKQQPTTQQPTTEQPTTQTPPAAQPSTEGTVLSSQETGEKAEFTVTNDDSANPTVAYKKTTEKKKKSVTIPKTVEVNGTTYKVTSIADNAFKGNKTVTKVTVGSNITSIGKNAFANCKKLKTVTVSKNVTDVGDNAFKGCAALTKVTLPAKTKKIGNNAFSGCKKLKTLTIKSKDLTSKTISKNAFKGITSKTTIKVPASKLAAYKKLFKKKGLAKNVKVTR